MIATAEEEKQKQQKDRKKDTNEWTNLIQNNKQKLEREMQTKVETLNLMNPFLRRKQVEKLVCREVNLEQFERDRQGYKRMKK